MDLEKYIRVVPDWPKPGISFKDITPLLGDAAAFHHVVTQMAAPFYDAKIAKVFGIEARGFLFAGALAAVLGCGAGIVRKQGKLPWKTVSTSYALEYGTAAIEIHEDAVRAGERVIVVDDIIATGGTLQAALTLLEQTRAAIVGVSVLGTLDFLPGAGFIAQRYPLHTLIHFSS